MSTDSLWVPVPGKLPTTLVSGPSSTLLRSQGTPIMTAWHGVVCILVSQPVCEQPEDRDGAALTSEARCSVGHLAGARQMPVMEE